ncbi:MAG: patatin-like phospholipase family protein [Polyangiaceae bacterium]|nr:patatin-like phospholipase family protein [Polyangiaceae bacterium]
MSYPPSIGLVLSGGGARGAYAVGVMQGITDALSGPSEGRAPFDVFCGTSVGAICTTWLAAHADEPDMNIDGLVDIWGALDIREHLRLDPVGFLSGTPMAEIFTKLRGREALRLGRSLLDPRALERLVEHELPYERLHANVARGIVRAVIVPALEVATGRTSLFAELADGTEYSSSRDPRRVTRRGPIEAAHVLASAAIPALFPARRIGANYYCDGGLRFNTPISPALRAGVDKLVVVSLLHEGMTKRYTEEPSHDYEQAYPSGVFLLGKLLNALLLDPVQYDLQVLARLNRMLETLEATLDSDEMRRVHAVFEETRELPYRQIETLVFRPSLDIGALALEHARRLRVRNISSGVLSWLSRLGDRSESDFLSFVMFDGEFARKLAELGRADARSRAAEIVSFFERAPELQRALGE